MIEATLSPERKAKAVRAIMREVRRMKWRLRARIVYLNIRYLLLKVRYALHDAVEP